MVKLGKGPATKSDEFLEKCQTRKNYIADFGELKQVFLSMKLIQKGNFRVQDMFFQQL